MPLKIATWNINSVRLREPLVRQFLEAHQPDILCLQEIKCMEEQFPTKGFHALGYEHIAIHGQKAYHGVATLSRLPYVEIDKCDFCAAGDARHISKVVEIDRVTIRVHNFYVPAGGDVADPAKNPKFAHKLQFIDEMRAVASCSNGIPAILVGDLNIAPLETDVWSHKQLLKVVSHTPVETEGLIAAQNAGGWIDLIRQHIPPREKVYTWWSYRAHDWSVSDRGRRLDHIWADPQLASHLANIEVLREARGWEKPSDHVPVIAEFDFA